MKKLIAILSSALFAITNIGLSNLTVFASDENVFTAVVNVYNEETNETVPNVEVKFVEYDADLPTNPQPQADVVQVLSNWNTSDANPQEIQNIEFVDGHFYAVQIDDIPEGYSYSWADHVITGIHGSGKLSGTVTYNVALQPHNPLPTLEYPLDITRNFTFKVVDQSTNEEIDGLDVELAEMSYDTTTVNQMNYAKTLDQWTTTSGQVHSLDIPLHFNAETDSSIVFGMKINNMPEGYEYEQEPQDGYSVCSYYNASNYKYDLYSENETTECIVYIYPEEQPPVYTSTAAILQTTTTTTTTTTGATTESDTSEMTEATTSETTNTTFVYTTDENGNYIDENGNILETTTTTTTTDPTTNMTTMYNPTTTGTTAPFDSTTTTTTTTNENTDDLPQTGMPWARAAEGLAVIFTVGGAIIALKSRKK